MFYYTISPDQNKTVRYYLAGDLDHVSKDAVKNGRFLNGERVSAEVNMQNVPRKLTFFIGDIEQPNFIVGIPGQIRFFAHISNKNSSFQVTKFEQLSQTSARGVVDSKELEWGKTWE
ncbi:MAG: hypothetical protein EZS28_022296 [Streblomastix strix]|uniref:Uncharacterized protein n=1 Tax=Streblomastix strix TaxID=222440 RepID=A0A5J4VI25_9EUKA|nr:MAG: hypothetical protein EZS28_022296 [Streblomastix strix]